MDNRKINDIPDDELAQFVKKQFGELPFSAFFNFTPQLRLFPGKNNPEEKKPANQFDCRQIAEQEAKRLGIPMVDIANFNPDPFLLILVPYAIARKHGILPIKKIGGTLVIAMSDPSDIFAIDDLHALTGYKINVEVTAEDELITAIEKCYSKTKL